MKQLCKNKHWNIPEECNIDKILYLLVDKPTRINSFGNFIWKNKKGWHRDYDLPAVIEARNFYNVQWYKYNKIHRENNKPAKIWRSGLKHYYVNGLLVFRK